MLEYKIKETISGLKALNNKYLNHYEQIVEKDRREAKEQLPEGAIVPRYEGLALEVNKNLLKECQGELLRGVIEQLSPLKERIDDYKTKAPTPEALQYLNFLEKINSLSRADIDLAIKKHGENYLIGRALLDLAENHDIDVSDLECTEDKIAENINHIEESYKGIIGQNHESLSASAYISIINAELNAMSPSESAEE